MLQPGMRARAAGAVLTFNGSENLFEHLQSVEYTDPAQGASDELHITMQDTKLEWLMDKYPKLGDSVSGALTLTNWNERGDNQTVKAGSFVLYDVGFTGGPAVCQLSCASTPADTSFKTRERTQVWEDITLDAIAGELCGRYGLALQYNAPTICITKIEQSQKSDSSFLEELCDKYDLGMKVFEKKLVIFGWGEMEGQTPATALTRFSFVDDAWNYHDTLGGIYTGAKICYKNGDNDEEIEMHVGDPTREVYINQTADTAAEAELMARAEVNRSNREMTTLSGDIWPDASIVSGMTVQVAMMGHANGTYFVDKMVFTTGESGTKQSIEMHKCQPRI